MSYQTKITRNNKSSAKKQKELVGLIGLIPTIEADLTKDIKEYPTIFRKNKKVVFESYQQEYLDRMIDRYENLIEPKEPMNYPPVRIKTINDQIPTKQNPYKANYDKRLIIVKQMNEWYQNGIIEPTTSPSASLILTVSKKTVDW